MKNITFFLFLIAILLLSCSGEKKKPIYVDVEEEESIFSQSDEVISVPFRESAGVKYVKVKVNGVGLDMIFDTGCSSTLISLAEANYLWQKGSLTEDDIIGATKSQIADGSIVENMVINLREVIIDDKIFCSDVQATVANNMNAPLLLGNEILNRLATITIDNENKALYFELK